MARILLVDEQPIARHALKLLLETDGHECVGEADNGLDAIQLARYTEAELVILELNIPRLGGLEVIQRIRSSTAGPRVLVFTSQDSEYFAVRCLDAGASGFVGKRAPLDELKAAIHAILNGHSHFRDQLLSAVKHSAPTSNGEALLPALSARELGVLQLLSKGMSNMAIAEQMALSDKTVSTYKTRLARKFQAGSLLEIVDIGRRHGLIEGQPATTSVETPFHDAQQHELALLRKIIDNLPHAISVRDPEGRMLLCNRHYLTQTGVDFKDIRGLRLCDTEELPAEIRMRIHKALMAVAATRQPYIRDGTITINGREKVIRHWGSPYLSDDGRYLGMLCGNIDLTEHDLLLLELRNITARAEAANRSKSMLLAAVGHEFGAPLKRLQPVLEDALTQDAATENLRTDLRRMVAFLDDLQALIRLDTSNSLLEPEPVNLADLLGLEVTGAMAPAGAKRLQLELNTTAVSQPDVWGDVRCFRLLFGNLLSNAVKFTDQGAIRASLAMKAAAWGLTTIELRIEDSGIGIQPDRQSRIFAPQPPTGTYAGRESSGLGLLLCKRFVEQMGGEITLQSEPGVGTTVTVQLQLTSVKR
ncbi:hypothetical protein JHS3_05920 [Jeongeupia sp. HS-3]|uniref:ATP-binding protein n=1 Tax=Jeongeupia sp. HS-3 TaxID=1009682 RepID=UPI0018A4E658|nr:ATP-binding protein [Jeongeupia sp. HS-3]BCL74856.1 hypothetical protein JHS3_05920 [Jeongeupia sp. HS-3]